MWLCLVLLALGWETSKGLSQLSLLGPGCFCWVQASSGCCFPVLTHWLLGGIWLWWVLLCTRPCPEPFPSLPPALSDPAAKENCMMHLLRSLPDPNLITFLFLLEHLKR